MKPQDLRLGNWVVLDWTGDKHPFNEEVQISNFVVLKEFEDGQRQYSGIVLTEEWLKKFGFEKIDSPQNGEHWNFEGVKIWQDEQSFYHINSETCTHFDCVHSLQNWYFAVTEEELKLK